MAIDINQTDLESNAQQLNQIGTVVKLSKEELRKINEESYKGEENTYTVVTAEIVTDQEDPPALVIETSYNYGEPIAPPPLAEYSEEDVVEHQDLPAKSFDLGIKIALAAQKDFAAGIKEDSILPGKKFSFKGTRVNEYLATLKCKPGSAPWSTAAVATWFKTAGAEIPISNGSLATGWYDWAVKTNRLSSTPVIGAAILYGTKIVDPITNVVKVTVNQLGCVVQVIDSSILLSIEVQPTTTLDNTTPLKLNQVQVNISATLGFIIPSKQPIKVIEAKKILEKKSDQIASSYLSTKKDGIHFVNGKIVFQQNFNFNQKPLYGKVSYGAGGGNVQEAGSALCAYAAAIRGLTGRIEVDPGFLARNYGSYHYKNPSTNKYNGTAHSIFKDTVATFGLKSKSVNFNKSKKEIIKTIESGGYPIIAGAKLAPYYGGGHFVYIRSYDKNSDTFQIGQSYLTKNTIQDMAKSYTFEELMGRPKDALIKTSGTMACYLITKA